VGVSADIGDELFGAAEGFLTIDHPLLASAFLEESLKGFGRGELSKGFGEGHLSFLEGLFHGVAEKFAHRF